MPKEDPRKTRKTLFNIGRQNTLNDCGPRGLEHGDTNAVREFGGKLKETHFQILLYLFSRRCGFARARSPFFDRLYFACGPVRPGPVSPFALPFEEPAFSL